MMPRLMHSPSLPEKIKPWRSAADGAALRGSLTLSGLPRLAAALAASAREVEIALNAGRDAQGFRFIQGELRTEAALICQRCLGALQLPLFVSVSLGLVRDEAEVAHLPAQYEPLLIAEDESISIAALIEDELLLALPYIPRHAEPQACTPLLAATPEPSSPTDTLRPFAALASLLTDSTRSH